MGGADDKETSNTMKVEAMEDETTEDETMKDHESVRDVRDTPSIYNGRKDGNDKGKKLKRKKRWLDKVPVTGLNRCAVVGGVIAVFIATFAYFIGSNEVRSLKLTELLQTYTNDPNFRAAVERMEELRKQTMSLAARTEEVLRPGEELFKKGRRAQYPVVLVPGVTSSTLELWEGRECAKGFRDVYWGGGHMVTLAVRNHTCWLEHLMLDTETWEDPQGIKLRSGSGYSATDYLFPGYWVWGKLIRNLADVGYDPSNMLMMSYDWRLAPQMLEKRDGYFTNLKFQIEFLAKRNNGRRVALVTHSMGSLWLHFFFNMVEKLEPGWTKKYVKKYINIAGSMLGVPKALGAAVSGEMKDIADIGQLGQKVLATFFAQDEILKCFRSIGSVPSMLPCGGSAVWAREEARDTITFDPPPTEKARQRDTKPKSKDLESGSDDSLDQCPVRTKSGDSPKFEAGRDFVGQNRSADDSLLFLEKVAPEYMDLVKKFYAINDGRWQGDPADNRTWMHPYLSPLPPGGHLDITCMYGVINASFSTEVGYHYSHRYPLNLNFEANMPERGLKNGVWLGQGDGSVPLQSLGYICGGPWRNKEKGFNSGGHKVIIREYKHEPAAVWESGGDLRGGDYAASHVEILGNKEIMRDVVTLVTEPVENDPPESEFALKDRVFSGLWKMVADIDKRRAEEKRKGRWFL